MENSETNRFVESKDDNADKSKSVVLIVCIIAGGIAVCVVALFSGYFLGLAIF